jgi:adenosine deaminase
MTIEQWVEDMPKVELHVHLEGSIRPETFLKLAKTNGIELPAEDLAGLRRWYQFTDFGHFIAVYLKIAGSLRTPADIEWIAREFLEGQARQNVRYCEVIYTPYNQYLANGIPFDEQMDALNRARAWAETKLGIVCQIILDISRETQPEEGLTVAQWAVSAMEKGVCALGLGGPEVDNPPEKFREAFALAREAGLPAIPHAGETVGPASIWSALEHLHPARIEHGVRCMEDPELVRVLRERQIPLDVCPTSNICLKVFPSLDQHPLPRMMAAGLNVTLNSDDPPLFNTSLTKEYTLALQYLGLDIESLQGLVNNGIRAALLPEERKQALLNAFARENAALAARFG